MPSSKPSSADPAERAAWFLLTETLTVLAATFALAELGVVAALEPPLPPPGASDSSLVWSFLAAFTVATVFVLVLLKKYRNTRLFEGIFLVAVFSGIASLTLSTLGAPAAVILTSLAVLLYYKAKTVLVYDLLLVVGCAGVAANLGGSLRPSPVAVILAVLAVYDILAVYVTKHMVTMAEALLRRKAFFAMILPDRPSGLLLPATEAAPGSGFMFLGTGDVVLPALLVASSARLAPLSALCTGIGALAGATVLHVLFLGQKKRKPMPALPPVAAGAILGYAISFFLPV